MPPVERKRRDTRFAEWDEKPVKDFDPENEAHDESEDSGGDESVDQNAGTEHYVSVGKSKLRQKEAVALGPEYRGARVSRAALDESSDDDEEVEDDEEEEEGSNDGSEEFDDPETADLEADHVDDDVEISSDNALGESDDEKLKDFTFPASSKPKMPKLNGRIAKRPTAADFMSSDGASGSGSEDEDGESEEDEDEINYSDEEEDSELEREGAALFDDEAEEADDDEGEDAEDDEGDEEEEDEELEDKNGDDDDDDQRAELRKIMSEGQKSIVATMSLAAKADAEKGAAVRQQRRAFDSILNLRIRLQKALVAANSFNVVEPSSQDASMEPYQAAEEAAVKLWNTIDSVRHSLMPTTKAKAGEKRKRDAITLETSNQDIWESMQSLESAAVSHRRKVLDKWSGRVRSTATVKTRRLGESTSQTLTVVLDDQLLSGDRLIKRARTPRSCAPTQAARKVEEDKDIYDDADFYQLLLKELVDQRSTDAAAPGGDFVATVRWAALKEAKTRKQVDRKASKGRKLRYTVHEKLQNFMAPEDRRKWEDHAIDRFFGTLFGQKMELKEDDVDEDEDQEMGGLAVEEDGLRLFRS
ncbi:apoptosis antagonizing transcription factor-domain-containing protein [Apodospora peruviana]|uniref:Protein BFR2 n=1 Tax=Apodospora peruviana TaxID=516989 RepID=A0AAE0I0Q6_9PEZI|nr:apoptosis antagonizing transcription factor-domain-containing protein [Apodospora peruviana]